MNKYLEDNNIVILFENNEVTLYNSPAGIITNYKRNKCISFPFDIITALRYEDIVGFYEIIKEQTKKEWGDTK